MLKIGPVKISDVFTFILNLILCLFSNFTFLAINSISVRKDVSLLLYHRCRLIQIRIQGQLVWSITPTLPSVIFEINGIANHLVLQSFNFIFL